MTVGVTVLGSTGSIGKHTLDVIDTNSHLYHVEALSACRNIELIFEQAKRFHPRRVVMADTSSASALRNRFERAAIDIPVGEGESGLGDIARHCGDTVVCGIVGAAGLLSTLAAVEAGKKVLIANKEPLVMLGERIVALAETHGACILPLDSEHNAIFQCLPSGNDRSGSVTRINADYGVKKVLLTGSGGPFRTLPQTKFPNVTPEQACAHPNWSQSQTPRG